MDSPQPTTAERPVSRPKEEIIREAKRIEEGLLHSSKRHFSASYLWTTYDALMSRVRTSSSIERWRSESDEVLAEKPAHLCDQKDKLNQSCPQIPH